MSWSAHKNDDYLTEHEEEKDELLKKAKELAKMIKECDYFTIFTGAGVSTSAGIPDYRGPEGVWTCRDRGIQRKAPSVSSLQAIPTYTHMSLVALLRSGILKHVYSQNCDGLHRKSGMRKSDISELHGNTNLEICTKCKREYLRDFSTTRNMRYDRKTKKFDHRTGRLCDNPKCRGELIDSIINFGESLNSEVLNRAWKEARKSDLCMSMGSSLTVTPACNIPLSVAKDGDYVIANLQKTKQDKHTSLRIFAKCDDLFRVLMKELNVKVPPFLLKRKVRVRMIRNRKKKDTPRVEITPIDFYDELRYDFIKSVYCSFFGEEVNRKPNDGNPLTFVTDRKKCPEVGTEMTFKIFPFSHYREPPVDLVVPWSPGKEFIYEMSYSPQKYVWKVRNKSEDSLEDFTFSSSGGEEEEVEEEEELVELIVGNSAKPENDENMRWKFSVREEEGEGTRKIQKVIIHLHKTFNPSVIEIQSPGPYEIERIGWGVFTIKAVIHLVNGKKISLEHMLSFRKNRFKKIKVKF